MSLRGGAARVDQRLQHPAKWIATLSVCTVLACVPGCRDDTPPDSAQSSARSYVPVEDDARNGGRIAAMLSIHAYARWSPSEFPPELRVAALDDAATFLAQDTGMFAKSRQRRALVKLGAYRYAAHDLDNERIVRALNILRPNSASYLKQQFDLFSTLKAGDNPPTAEELETYAYDLPQFAELNVAGCPAHAIDLPPPKIGPEAHAEVTISVEKGVCSVAPAMDPQNWDVCSKFFKPPEHTYLAQVANLTPTPEPTIPGGTAYGGVLGERKLFEEFTCPKTDSNGKATGCDAKLKNMLLVSTRWDSVTGNRVYFVRYSLPRQGGVLSGQVNGVPETLTADQGGGDVTEKTSTSVTVKGTKTLRFEDPILTGGMQAVFTVMMDEIAGEFAELSCCKFSDYAGPPCDVTPTP